MVRQSRQDERNVVPLLRGDFLVAGVVALVVLGLDVWMLAPGLLQADSGELQTLSATLGYAHPTGCPVYLLLGKLATFLPVGSIAYRVNLLSALFAAVAAGGLCLLGNLLCGRRYCSAVGALALCVSPTFWSQAIVAEVYACGVALAVGVLLGLELWRQTGQVRWLFTASCLGGISLGVHSTVALLAPAALLMVVLTPDRWKANWTAAILGAMTGVAVTLAAFATLDCVDSPTSYFRTVVEPSRSVWNLESEDVDGYFDRVRLSFAAPQFRGLLTSQPPDVTRRKAGEYATNLAREFSPFWLAAAVVGIVWLGRRNWRMSLVLGLMYFTHAAYDLQFDGVVHVLYIATYVPIAIWGAAGLAALADGCRELAGRFSRRSIPCDLLIALVGLGIVGWPMLQAGAFNEEGRRTCWVPPEEDPPRVEYSAEFHRDVARLIDELPADSVVFTGWCLLYPYYYVAHVEKGRTDLRFIQDYPHPDHFELADSAFEYVKEVSPQRPVLFTHRVKRVAESFELSPIRCGKETFYRVGVSIELNEKHPR